MNEVQGDEGKEKGGSVQDNLGEHSSVNAATISNNSLVAPIFDGSANHVSTVVMQLSLSGSILIVEKILPAVVAEQGSPAPIGIPAIENDLAAPAEHLQVDQIAAHIPVC